MEIPAGAAARCRPEERYPEERYKVVRSDLSAAITYLPPHLGGIDTTTILSPAQREERRQT
jgi:hypothetical protein